MELVGCIYREHVFHFSCVLRGRATKAVKKTTLKRKMEGKKEGTGEANDNLPAIVDSNLK